MPEFDDAKFGRKLVVCGIITQEQLQEAMKEKEKTKKPLSQSLVKMGILEEEAMAHHLAEEIGIPYVDLSTFEIERSLLALIPENLAREHNILPLFKVGNTLTIAVSDPNDVRGIDAVHARTGLAIDVALASEGGIKKSIDSNYGAKPEATIEEIISTIDTERLGIKEGGELEPTKLERLAEETPVVKLVNALIFQALKEGASDIHIEPDENVLRTRYRIDGILHEVTAPPKRLAPLIVSRIKIMANMDIAQHMVPQDGRFNIKLGQKAIDVRASCVPTVYGENVVLRLLDRSRAIYALEQLGFAPEVLKKYQEVISRPNGIVLATGPTGCGKTTTLYASLNAINSVEKNIITIEDPVEYKLDLVRQIQLNPRAGLTFANALRSVVRQDPDVIMIGEIRDIETADIAIHAALTGHLVFSTLHTNDAAGAIARLIDMGVEPFLVASSISAVLAQRLIRTICPRCRESYKPAPDVSRQFGLAGEVLYRGRGCQECRQTGYKGRTAIFELMIPDDGIKELAVAKSNSEVITKRAIEIGMKTLRDDGMAKVKSGVTTAEEVLRATREA